MVKRRNQNIGSWITIVTILTVVIGLVALISVLKGNIQKHGHNEALCQEEEYDNFARPKSLNRRRSIDNLTYPRSRKPSVCHLTPHKVGCLETQVEVPLEIVRHRPCYSRPKVNRAHMRERVDRLERNVSLLKKTQKQTEALKELQERINALQNMSY